MPSHSLSPAPTASHTAEPKGVPGRAGLEPVSLLSFFPFDVFALFPEIGKVSWSNSLIATSHIFQTKKENMWFGVRTSGGLLPASQNIKNFWEIFMIYIRLKEKKEAEIREVQPRPVGLASPAPPTPPLPRAKAGAAQPGREGLRLPSVELDTGCRGSQAVASQGLSALAPWWLLWVGQPPGTRQGPGREMGCPTRVLPALGLNGSPKGWGSLGMDV